MKLDGAPLPHDEAFASLIEAGYQVVDSDFDEITFKKWRQQAIACISSLLGAEHPYTRSFSEYVRNCDLDSLFLGRGLVDATKRDVLMKMKQSGKELTRLQQFGNS
ncbi:MAG: hypothetical protein WC647_12450 [Desulfomonilaceae bacterium]|jgi:hypothetical protein